MNRIAAIHQPSFFPWLGFLNKVYRSDIFVLLDNVQFPKTGGFWANRVPLLINGKSQWLTIPIVRNYHGFRNINKMEINNSTDWRTKHLKTIQANYAKTEYYKIIYPIIEELLQFKTDNLFEYNLNIIIRLFNLLELNKRKIINASDINNMSGSATDMLITILKEIKADTYICGAGSADYQEDEKFEKNSIKLIHQNYKHPIYKQYGSKEFVKGLSVIDAMMNTGIVGTKKLIAEE